MGLSSTRETGARTGVGAPAAGRSTDGDRAFRALLAAGASYPEAREWRGLGIDRHDRLVELDDGDRDGDAECLLVRDDGAWRPAGRVSPEARAVLDLYLPVCGLASEASLTVAHLGQSLDGQIAAASGDSYYVTGPANLLHMHRMRALCDAVVVGAETVAMDDPRLTVRRTTGDAPVRVVLDPRRRLGDDRRVFRDGAAPTLLVAGEDRAAGTGERHGLAEVVAVPARDGRLALDALLAVLHARGLRTVFIEGGGATVSRFLDAGLLDRLQIAVAALVAGRGRPGLDVLERARLRDGLRPAHRVFRMGCDVLFDCDLRAAPAAGADQEIEPRRVL